MKKIKKVILSLIVVLSVFFSLTFIGSSTNKKVQAGTPNQLDVETILVKKEEFVKYKAILDNNDFLDDLLDSFFSDYFDCTEYSGKKSDTFTLTKDDASESDLNDCNAIWTDPTYDCLAKYGYYPFEMLKSARVVVNNKGRKTEVLVGLHDFNWTPVPTATAGQELVLMTFVSNGSDFKTVQLHFDPTFTSCGYSTGSGALATDYLSSGKIKYGITDGSPFSMPAVSVGSYNPADGGSSKSSVLVSGNGTGNISVDDNSFIGAWGFKVASTASGTYTLGVAKSDNVFWTVTTSNYPYKTDSSTGWNVVNYAKVTITGNTTTANVKEVKVGSTTITAPATKVNTDMSVSYHLVNASVNAGTASVGISATEKDNGKCVFISDAKDTIAELNTLCPSTATLNGLSAEVSPKNVTPGAAGSDKYVLAIVQGQSAVSAGSYNYDYVIIKLTTSKYSTIGTTSIALTGGYKDTTGTSTCTSASLNADATVAATDGYKLTASDDIKSVKIALTYSGADSALMKYSLDGGTTKTAVTGSPQEIFINASTIGTNNNTFTIQLYAQDGTLKKTYTIKQNIQSTDASLSTLQFEAVSAANSSQKVTLNLLDSTHLSGTTITVSASELPYIFNTFMITPSVGSGKTIKITSTSTSLTTVASGAATNYKFTAGEASKYKCTTGTANELTSIKVEVTPTVGAAKTYTINITRDSAKDNKTFSVNEQANYNTTATNKYTIKNPIVYSATGTTNLTPNFSSTDYSRVSATISCSTSGGAAFSGYTAGNAMTSGTQYQINITAVSGGNAVVKFVLLTDKDIADGGAGAGTTFEYTINFSKYSDNFFTGLTVSAYKDATTPASIASPNFLNTSNAVTSYSYTVSNYKIKISSDTTKITFNGTYSTGLPRDTMKIGIDNALPSAAISVSGGTFSVDSSVVTGGQQIKLYVFANDGTQCYLYTFDVVVVSSDTKVTSIEAEGNFTTSVKTLATLSSTTYSVANTNLVYADTEFKLTIAAKAGQTFVLKDGSTNIAVNSSTGESASIKFGNGNIKKTLTLVVTASAGNSDTYSIEVNRQGALNDHGLTVSASYADGSAISWTGTSPHTATTNVTHGDKKFTIYGVVTPNKNSYFTIEYPTTGIYYTVKDQVTGATISNGTKLNDNQVVVVEFTRTNSDSATITFKCYADSDLDKPVPSPTSYAYKVTKDAADDTATFDYEIYYMDGASQITVFSSQTGGVHLPTPTGTTTITYNANNVVLPALVRDLYVKITPTKPTYTVDYSSTDFTGSVFTYTLNSISTTATANYQSGILGFAIKTEATPSGKPINIQFTSKFMSNQNSISNVKVYGVNDTSNPVSVTPNGTSFDQRLNKDTAGNEYYLEFTIPAGAKAYWYYNDSSKANPSDGVELKSYNASNVSNPKFKIGAWDNNVDKLMVNVYAENGSTKTYTFNIQGTDPRDTRTGIKSITFAETAQMNPVFSFGTYDYSTHPTIVVPYGLKTLSYTVTLEFAKESVTVGTSSTPSANTPYNMDSVTVTGTIDLTHLTDAASTSVAAGSVITYYFAGKAENGDYAKNIGDASTYQGIFAISFKRAAAEKNALVTDFRIDGTTVTGFSSSNLHTIVVTPHGTSLSTVTFAVSNKAHYKMSCDNGESLDGTYYTTDTTLPGKALSYMISGSLSKSILVTIEVLSEEDFIDTPSKTGNKFYYLIVAASTDSSISNIEILQGASGASALEDVSGNSYVYGTTTGVFNVSYGAEKPYFEVTKANYSSFTTTSQHGLQNVPAGSTQTFKIEVVSELYEEAKTRNTTAGRAWVDLVDATTNKTTKSISIKKDNGSTVNTLDWIELEFSNGYKKRIMGTETFPYQLPNVGLATSVDVTVYKTDPKSIVTGHAVNSNTNQQTTYKYTINWSTSGAKTDTVTVNCESEESHANNKNILKPYSVQFGVAAIDLSKEKSIQAVSVMGGSTEFMTGVNQFAITKYAYALTIPAGLDSVNLTVTPTDPLSTFTMTASCTPSTETACADNTLTTGTPKVIHVPEGGSTIVTIICNPQDPAEPSGSPYTITISRPTANNDATLKELKVNTVTVPNFVPSDASKLNYTVHLDEATDTALFYWKTTDTNASVISPTDDPVRYTLAKGETKEVKITVQAENKKTETYTVTLTRDDVVTVDDITFTDGSGNPILDVNGNPVGPFPNGFPTGYTVTVPYTVKSYKLDVDPTSANVKVSGSNTASSGRTAVEVTGNVVNNLQVGTNNITVEVEAASGFKVPYNITIIREAGASDAYITNFTIGANEHIYSSFSQGDFGPYYYQMDSTKSKFVLADAIADGFVTLSTGASAKVLGTTALYRGTMTLVEIEVTSQDGGTVHKYQFYMCPSSSTAQIDNIVFQTAKTVTTPLVDGSGNYTLFDQVDRDGFYQDATDVTSSILPSLQLLFGSKATNGFLAITANAQSYAYLDDQLYTSSMGTKSITTTGDTYTIYALSEFGNAYVKKFGTKILSDMETDHMSPEYTLSISKKPLSTDNTLKCLVIRLADGSQTVLPFVDSSDNSIEVTFAPNIYDYIINNIGDTVTNLSVEAVPTDPDATVTGDGPLSMPTKGVDASGKPVGYTTVVTILVTPSDTTAQKGKYTVTISRDAVKLEDNNEIEGINLFDSKGNYYLKASDFNANTKNYNYNIAVGATTVTFEVILPSGSMARVVRKAITPTFSDPNSSGVVNNIDKAPYPGATVTYEIYAVSSSGKEGTHYEFELTFGQADSDSSLKQLLVELTPVNGFADIVWTGPADYRIPVDGSGIPVYKVINSVTSVEVYAKATKDTSTVTGAGTITLSEGDNPVVVTCRAEDGTESRYIFVVRREKAAPTLLDLAVVGQTLRKQDNTPTSFDPNVKDYLCQVSYYTNEAIIQATLSDGTVAISPSLPETTNAARTTFNYKYENIAPNSTQKYTIRLTSAEAVTNDYTITITKLGVDSINTKCTIKLPDVPEFVFNANKHDYTSLDLTVPNEMKDVEVLVTTDNPNAEVTIINNKNLKTTMPNIIVVQITATDGETVEYFSIPITRAKMTYEVDKEATEYLCTPDEGNTYTINLGNNKATDITSEQYINYIKKGNDNMTVEILGGEIKDNASSVILKVSDGSEVDYVTLNLATAPNTSLFSVAYSWVWLVLAIGILILILILISVNTDKFGKIAYNRKKM